MRMAIILSASMALAGTALSSASITHATHEEAHPVGLAAWEVDGVAVDQRAERLNAEPADLVTVEEGDRVRYLVRLVDQSADVDIQLSFNSPGHAYVLGSASGGSCAAPFAAAPGIFQHSCTVAIGDDGSGDLLVTYEITASSEQACNETSGEPDVATLVLSEPQAWRTASDVRVCGSQSAAPAPTATPAGELPDTAAALDAAAPPRPDAIIGFGALILLVGSLVLLPRRR